MAGTIASTGSRSANSTSRSLRIDVFWISINNASTTPNPSPARKSAEGKKRTVRERWPVRQVSRVEHAELLPLLFSLQIHGHFGILVLLLQVVVRLHGRLISARQFLELLLHSRRRLNASLISLDLLPDLILLLGLFGDRLVIIADDRSQLRDLRRLDLRILVLHDGLIAAVRRFSFSMPQYQPWP